MSYDPNNDVRLRREDQRRQEGFRLNAQRDQERNRAESDRKRAEYHERLRDIRNTPSGYTAPVISGSSSGSSQSGGGFDSLWRLVSILGGFAAGFIAWRATYTAQSDSPWISIGVGACAGWIAAKIIDSGLIRGLAKLAFYAAIVIGVLWLIAQHGN